MAIRFDPLLGKLLTTPRTPVQESTSTSGSGPGDITYIAGVPLTKHSAKWLVSVFYDNGTGGILTDDESTVYEVNAQFLGNEINYSISNILSTDINVTVDVVNYNNEYILKITNNETNSVLIEVVSLKQ